MRSHVLKRAIVSVAAVTIAATALTIGADSAIAAAPPFEPDPSSVGTLTFYDANGNVMTSGRTDTAPFANYAVGSVNPRPGDLQAQTVFANPDPNSQPAFWYNERPGSYNHFPITSGPAAVRGMNSSHPAVVGDAGDQTLDGFEQDSVRYSGTGYLNVVQIRVRTANSANQPTTTYDDADVMIDASAHTWTQIYPDPGPATHPGVPTGVTATPGSMSATVRWTAPTDTGGAAISGYALESSGDGGTTWSAPVQTGATTTAVVSGLTDGTSYVFRVAATNSAGTGDFSSPSTAVTPASDQSKLTIAGPSTVNAGATAKITGTLVDSASHPLAGQSVTLYSRPNSKTALKAVKRVTTSSTGAAAVSVKPLANAQFEWKYSGLGTHLAASSAVKSVAVKPAVTASADHVKVAHGKTVTFYGTLTPASSGGRVYLQQLHGKKWKTTKITVKVKRQKLPNHKTATGYRLPVKLSKKGAYEFRVYKPATAGLQAGYSRALKVKAT